MTAGMGEHSYMFEASKEIEQVLSSTLPNHEKVRLLAEKSMHCENFSQALAFKVVEQLVRAKKMTIKAKETT